MALVSVLWGISILSVIATVALAASLTYRHIAANSWQATHAHMIAEAAIVRAALALTDSRPSERWRVDGVPQTFEFDGAKAQVAIQDELGKVDLNTAREDILRNLFHAVLSDPKRADTLTDRVLDWRTPGAQKRLNGASPKDYEDAGLGYHPRGQAFQSVEEVKLVMGMTDALYDQIAPAITVYSTRSAIDLRTAPALAFQAASGLSAQAAKNKIAVRRTGILDPAIGLSGRAFTIYVEVNLQNRIYSHKAVIRLTGDPARPYWILAWESAPAPHASQ